MFWKNYDVMRGKRCFLAIWLLVFAACTKNETPQGVEPHVPYQATYEVGDVFENDTLKGVVFYTYGAHNGLMVSLEDTLLPWCVPSYTLIETGATNPYDGWNNTNIVMSNHDMHYYPAIRWSHEKNTWHLIYYPYRLIDHKQWYVPSTTEMRYLLMNQNAVNATLDSLGCPTLENKTFWSSTETGTRAAAAVRMQNGQVVISDSLKDQEFYVRAIRNY